MCGCSKKKPSPEAPLPRFSIKIAGSGGSAVTIGARESCVIEVNERVHKLRGGEDVRMYDFQARALEKIGAPIWIAS